MNYTIKNVYSSAVKNTLASAFLLFSLSAYSATNELDASVDKTTLDQFTTFNYTVTYQGKAEQDALVLENINEFDILFHILETNYEAATESNDVTTWKVIVAALDEGELTIPKLTLNDSKTPEIMLNVNKTTQLDDAKWEIEPYKQDVAVGEKISIKASLTYKEPENILKSGFLMPDSHIKYEFLTVEDEYAYDGKKDDDIAHVNIEVSLDKAGTYDLSLLSYFVAYKQDGELKTQGTNAPTFKITAK